MHYVKCSAAKAWHEKINTPKSKINLLIFFIIYNNSKIIAIILTQRVQKLTASLYTFMILLL